MTGTKILALSLSLFILLLVVELIRREKLTFKYAFGWLLAAALAVIFSVFDQLVFSLAFLLGFQLPSNFIFFALFCGFVFLSLLLTIFLCQQEKHNNTMAQKIGIFEQELNELKNK